MVEVEADISSNLPGFQLVGLPDVSVTEAAARVRAACTNSGLALPGRKITVNLSPASVPKQGSGFDLAIAVAVLAASGQVDSELLRDKVFLGELSLDGSIKPITGVLSAVLAARDFGLSKVMVPLANLAEAKMIAGMEIAGFDHLSQVAVALGAQLEPKQPGKQVVAEPAKVETPSCYSEVLGQPEALEALVVAAVGGHHALMVGPPGAGKTMLASRFPGIMPELSETAAIELAAIRSIAKVPIRGLDRTPPFQAPHHTASVVSLIGGGGASPRPGLISLAHHGTLFLDEAPEFQSDVLESLRQPLESGQVTISRASGHATFPAQFQLLLAANPCPCGNAIGTGKACTCAATAKLRYFNRISGPLADRIDIRLTLNAVNASLVLDSSSVGETSVSIRARVQLARASSMERLKLTPWFSNAKVPGPYLRKQLRLPPKTTSSLDQALDRGHLTMRGYDRCLRVAWSLADLAGQSSPDSQLIAQAIYLRGGQW